MNVCMSLMLRHYLQSKRLSSFLGAILLLIISEPLIIHINISFDYVCYCLSESAI